MSKLAPRLISGDPRSTGVQVETAFILRVSPLPPSQMANAAFVEPPGTSGAVPRFPADRSRTKTTYQCPSRQVLVATGCSPSVSTARQIPFEVRLRVLL